MKILLLYLNLNQGGVQRMMVNVANYLSGKGFDVTILLCRKEGQYLASVHESINVISLESDNRLNLINYLATYLKTNKTDVLFTAVPHLNLIAIIAKLISRVKTRIVLSERSNTIEEFRKSPLGAYKVSFLLIPFLYRFADEIIAVSKGVAVDLAKVACIPFQKISVVYNPAYNEKMIQEALLPVQNEWLNNPKIPVIVGVGRLTEQKDFPLLIDATREVLKKRPVRLLLIGEGALHTMLQQKIDAYGLHNNVMLAGFQGTPISWISKASLFVLSSKWEGFGNILVEALAAGTTIVSTDCKSGPYEILQGGKFGYLARVGDVKDLASKIDYALDNPMSAAILKKRAEDFDVNKVMKNYERILLNKKDSSTVPVSSVNTEIVNY